MNMASVTDYIKGMIDQAQLKKARTDLQDGEYVSSLIGLTLERRPGREKLGKVLWIDYVIDQSEGASANTPGTKLESFLNLEGPYAHYAAQDLKRFFVELTGCQDTEASKKFEELVDHVNDDGKHSNPAQKVKGMQIGIKTRRSLIKSGKNAGQEKVYPTWHGIPQTADEVAENRKRLEKLGL
jgi:hypothetical protein